MHGSRHAACKDFSRGTLFSLERRGIMLIGITIIPDPTSDLPIANGERGYKIDDNGTGKVVRFQEILNLANRELV